MDEKIEKLISLAGNEHRYQYLTLVIIMILWINSNFISCVLPFIERQPIINYIDPKGEFHENVTLTSDICLVLNGRNYSIVESFGYSWTSEFNIECKSFEISAIGSFAYMGYALGGLVFSFISKLISYKKILIISSFGFGIMAFLCTLVTSFDYFYALVVCEVFMGLFGNCLCYSSLVITEEIVSNKKRSLFSSLINVGYSLSGVLYAIPIYLFQDWRKVFYTLISSCSLTLILIWIFIYDSPRIYINNNNYEKVMEILEGIAKFNGKLDEFRESIKQDEYQEIINIIKGESSINSKQKKEQNDENDLRSSLVDKDIQLKKINVWSIFKYPSIRYKFLFLNFLWIGAKVSFNGISISSKSFPGNFFVNIVVLCIIESISCLVQAILIDIKKLGRKGTLWIEYTLLIIIFALLTFLDLDTAGSLALNYIARFCVAGIEVIYYTYTIELYPTPVRSVAFGINATIGNAGSISAPLLLEFLLNSQFLLLLSVINAINAVVLVCLPETVGKPMVESIPELDEENDILTGDKKILNDDEDDNTEINNNEDIEKNKIAFKNKENKDEQYKNEENKDEENIIDKSEKNDDLIKDSGIN